MKILLTADVHISDWPAHSTYDEIGTPSRLALYDLLAADILEVIRERKVQVAFYAGDILQKHSPRPMVANAARRFMRTLAGDATDTHESVWMPGNHDIDGKTGRYDPTHSGLWPLVPSMERVHYDPVPRVRDFGDFTAYVRPWVHGEFNYGSFPDADIFVGHGMVKGSSDPFNYTFTGGYDAEELGKRYELSVLGDIHQAQIIQPQHSTGRVLIPGQPIQVNHSSGAQVGVWIYDTESKRLEHVPSSKFSHADEYHKFLTVESEPEVPAINTHYRRRTAKANNSKKAKSVAPLVSVVDVLDIALKEFASLNPAHLQIGEDLIKAAYNDFCSVVQPEISMPPGMLLGKLTIDSFYSVEKAEFDFSELVGDVLVVGENGCGKSTMAESVYWCLTGNTTKNTAVSDISNDLTGRPATVSLEIHDTVGGITYTVSRSRDSNRLLEIYSGESKITKASVKESQEWLYKLLGLSGHRDILVLLYFSTAQLVTFSDYTSAEQGQLLNRLTDSDKYEALRTALLDSYAASTEGYREAAERFRFNKESIENKEIALAAALRVVEAAPAPVVSYDNELQELADVTGKPKVDSPAEARAQLKVFIDELESRIKPDAKLAVDKARGERNSVNAQLQAVQGNLSNLKSVITTTKAKIEQVRGNHCSECGQVLQDDTVLNRLMAKLRTDADSMRAIATQIAELRPRVAAAQTALEVAQADETYNSNIDFSLRSARALDYQISSKSEPASDGRTAARSKLEHITEDLSSLRQQSEALKSTVEMLAPYHETLKLIATKMLAKNSALSMRLIKDVFESMVAKVNELVGNPKVFKAKAETGKALGITVSFGGEKSVGIQNMSAGQRRLLDIMIMLAVNSLFEQRYNIENGMLGIAFYDEVIAYLGPEYLDIVFTALSNTRARTRVMITHDADLMSYYNRSIRVSREGGFTQYQLINT